MDKKFLRIGEVSKITGVSPRVLRYWEKEFPMLKPHRHKGNRYYSPDMVELILKIKELLDKGMNADAVRKRLEEGVSEEERGFLRILAGIKEEINEILEYMDACERDRINKGL
ncbi:MerR family transcriptional regulator [Thermosulfidibacter takaii ABI70S6]|uniref:MerR family transcriptional regulator n=1 Tax=Thermosulfidibacter takaii (strain DSM 17441 / JCM 13301 / NBRC 103674 / ABI70S6) TaxID=1298851 RepID=A0A0S3QSA8_THET7|nr:MerR family transcriptional regulator [Thermosulfidibacter takaii]BAT71231.1 MerR family transcriptional regulator [Thermosulfidibacter takaii ABI70S6]